MKRKKNAFERWRENPARVEEENRARFERLVIKHGAADARRRYFEWATRGVLW